MQLRHPEGSSLDPEDLHGLRARISAETGGAYAAFRNSLEPDYARVRRDIALGYGALVISIVLTGMGGMLAVPVGALAVGFIVAYLQLVRPDHKTSGLYEAVSEVSRGLKALAKTHDVGVMALTQLSRKVEERQDKRPHMADLRDSGQIEQDADAILFLYRPEYYLRQCEPQNPADRLQWEEDCQREAGKIEFIVAKRRRGPSGSAEGKFFTAFQAVRG